MTLSEFLLARLAEDEAVAHSAAQADCPRHDRLLWTCLQRAVPCDHGGSVSLGPRGSIEASPARVLADVEAKRRIVACASPYLTPNGFPVLLAILARTYADHPDYNESWRP